MTPKLAAEIKQTKPFSSIQVEVLLNLARTADEITRRMELFFRQWKITGTQYNVLRIVAGAGSEGILCSEVGARMVTRTPDTTRLLDRIERTGYIRRERSTTDRRAIRVLLTDAGAELLRSVRSAEESYVRGLFPELTERELTDFNRLLEKARE